MAASQPEEEKQEQEPKKTDCTCPYGCICDDKEDVIAILRSQKFRDKYGSLVDLAVTENGDFTTDRDNEKVGRMETEAYFMLVLRKKIPQYPPVDEEEKPMPKHHLDVFREIHDDDLMVLKKFYCMSSEEMIELDRRVWQERTRWLKHCEEKYLVTILGATHQSEERRKELYAATVGVLLDYILEEGGKHKTGELCLNCPVHALRALSPFADRLTEAGLDRILRLIELDKRHTGIQRELRTLVLCWINHPKYGLVVAETLGKILLNCSEEHFTLYAVLMREIFYYICPIPGVHMSVPPDVFSMLIKYHCVALLISNHREVNKEIVDNLKIARAFDSIPIVERAYECNRVHVETYHDPHFVIFMSDVGYPVFEDDHRVKKCVERQVLLNKECRKLGVEKDVCEESWKRFMKRVKKEQKRWKKAAEEDEGIVERKKDMDLLADCMTRSVELWIWHHGETITSAFMSVPEKPHRFALDQMPELAELVEKNNPKPVDPKMVKDLLEQTEHRVTNVPPKSTTPETENGKTKSTNPEVAKNTSKTTEPQVVIPPKIDRPKSTKPEIKNLLEKDKRKSTKPEPTKGKPKSAKQGSVGKTKAEKSDEKTTSSKATSDADTSTSSQTQEETSAELDPEQLKSFKVKQLQRCGFCNRQELPEAKFQKCGRCRKTRYCSKQCQHQHWRGGHKDECKEKKPDDLKEAES
ncbi:Hypp739 [Branchiostoma lanceolatum]|uniref:Hypp739 protein n=1 Tax=Branchiostoma lanceolatum TaxID=7740 RepID=A0A8J9VW59_BRALA|nr:Hypp739 [Branchiostoma lanceolatum]